MRATYCYANGFKSRTAGGPATPAAILSRHRRYRHAPCRDFPCLTRLWPGSPTATARPGRTCCRASSGSAVRLIEASAPLRERAAAGISDPAVLRDLIFDIRLPGHHLAVRRVDVFPADEEITLIGDDKRPQVLGAGHAAREAQQNADPNMPGDFVRDAHETFYR